MLTLDPAVRAALLEALVAGDLLRANDGLARLPGPAGRLRVERVNNARTAEAAPVWRAEADGRHLFRFHERSWAQHPRLIFGRWLDMLPLVAAVMAAGARGRVSFNLGDEAHRPGLSFCDRRDDAVLVPDCMFMATGAYAALARHFAAQALPWTRRRPVLFWRGATSGTADGVDFLPRVQLCRLARRLGDQADVGLSAVTDAFRAAEPTLRAEELVRPFVPAEATADVQLHVDIDGNSNSWPGLFTKLLSGSPVLKVASPQGFRQWYYPRLVPGVNFVPVRADLADLLDVARDLLADPDRAQAIGKAGRRLALDLSLDREVAAAVPRIRAAFEPF